MKLILRLVLSIFFLVCLNYEAKAQRYVTEIFNSINSITDILYGSSINYLNKPQNLYLDFYEPFEDTVQKRPLIIYIHGGGFTDKSNHKSMSHIVSYCESMAKKGYAVASIDYRLDTTISNRAIISAMHDAKAAVRYFRANAIQHKIDTSLIFIGGESAGAVTALTTTYVNQTSEVFYPPTPPITMDTSIEGNSGNPNFSSAVKAIMCNCGGTETAFNDIMFDTLSMRQEKQPIMILHGTADPLVPFQKSVDIAKRANNLAIPNLFYAFKGATHCPWYVGLPNQRMYLDSLINLTTTFLYANVIGTSIPRNKVKNKSLLQVFPNPTKDILNVDLDLSNLAVNQIKIISQEGEAYDFKKVSTVNNPLQFDVSKLNSGSYLIQIETDDTTYSTQFIKSD